MGESFPLTFIFFRGVVFQPTSDQLTFGKVVWYFTIDHPQASALSVVSPGVCFLDGWNPTGLLVLLVRFTQGIFGNDPIHH